MNQIGEKPATAGDDRRSCWARVAPSLIGEALTFQGAGEEDRKDGLVVGVAGDSFLVYRPGLSEPEAAAFSFDEVAAITPLGEAEAERLRTAFDRMADGGKGKPGA